MPDQLTREDLKNMTPEAINAARAEGRLDVLLGLREAEAPEPGGLSMDILADLSPEALDILIAEHRAEVAAAARGSGADQGARPGPPRGQLSRADLQGMSPEATNQAREEGRLDVLLGRDQ